MIELLESRRVLSAVTAQATIGQAHMGMATVTISGAVTGMASPTVSIMEGSNSLATVSAFSGPYTASPTLSVGVHNLTITAHGMAMGFFPASASTTLTVTVTAPTPTPPTITAQVQSIGTVSHGFATVSIRGTVTGLNNGATVTIAEGTNNSPICTATVSNGAWSASPASELANTP